MTFIHLLGCLNDEMLWITVGRAVVSLNILLTESDHTIQVSVAVFCLYIYANLLKFATAVKGIFDKVTGWTVCKCIPYVDLSCY